MQYYLLTLEISQRVNLVIVPGDSRREDIDAANLPVITYGCAGWDLCQVSPSIIMREDRFDSEDTAALAELLRERRAAIGTQPADTFARDPQQGILAIRPVRATASLN